MQSKKVPSLRWSNSTTNRELTAKELAAVQRYIDRGGADPKVKLKTSSEEPGKLEIDYDDEATGTALLMDALGTAESDFAEGIISQLVSQNTKGGEVNQRGLSFMLAVVKGVEPKDQLEAMLAAQMASVHVATMMLRQRLACSRGTDELDSAERAFNKLARTFANQLEALNRYRTGAPHTLQNVSVTHGGQAVVANITHPPSETGPSKATASEMVSSKTNVVPLPRRSDLKKISRR
jgi:hypothetical protein